MAAANVLLAPTGKASGAALGSPETSGEYPAARRQVPENAPTLAAPAPGRDVDVEMLRAETARAHSFARVALVLTTLGLGFLWIEGPEGCLRRETAVAMVALIAISAVVWFRTRR